MSAAGAPDTATAAVGATLEVNATDPTGVATDAFVSAISYLVGAVLLVRVGPPLGAGIPEVPDADSPANPWPWVVGIEDTVCAG